MWPSRKSGQNKTFINQRLTRRFDIWVELAYNDVMEMKKMTFAPGWVQIIDPANEKQDLLSYISDTYKSVYGFRPRWGSEWLNNATLKDLREEAADLEAAVLRDIEDEKVRAHERMLEANRVALIHRNAKKPVSRTFKPFANLKEMLV